MFKSINLHTYVGNNFSCPLWQPKSLNRVIPIVVSPCVWKFDPVIRRLQALPSGSGEGVLPVSEWKNHNLAWASVVEQIGDMAQGIHDKREAMEQEEQEKELAAKKTKRIFKLQNQRTPSQLGEIL